MDRKRLYVRLLLAREFLKLARCGKYQERRIGFINVYVGDT